MVVLLPLLTLTGASLGVELPKWVLVIALALEIIGVIFALALIVLPRRAWQFGRLQSDVQHGLTMTSVRVLLNPQPSTPTVICAFELEIQNQTEQALRCHIEKLDVVIREGNLRTPSATLTLIVPTGVKKLQSATVTLPKSKQLFNAEIDSTVLFGPASGQYEVRWCRSQLVTFLQDTTKLGAVSVLERRPDSYDLIKPIKPSPE